LQLLGKNFETSCMSYTISHPWILKLDHLAVPKPILINKNQTEVE